MNCAVVVGNPKPQSRTLQLANTVMAAILGRLEMSIEPLVIDLADHAAGMFDWGDKALNALTQRVTECDLVVAASPTYKATYTGLLKGFFDRYTGPGLAGVVMVPVMMGAAPIHALAPEVFMRPLFVELGGIVPTRGIYVLESQMDGMTDIVEK